MHTRLSIAGGALIALTLALACNEEPDAPASGETGGSGGKGGSSGGKAPGTGGYGPAGSGTGGEGGRTENDGDGGSPVEGEDGGTSGVGGEGAQGGEGGSAPEPTWKLRAMTYNAAIAPGFAPYALERAAALASILAQPSDLDLLCLQEVWIEPVWSQLAPQGLPHLVRREAEPGSGTCTEEEAGNLTICLGTNCSSAGADELVPCASQFCGPEIAALSGGCMGCVLNGLGGNPMDCVGPEEPADPAIYGGEFDVGLFSRYPLIESDSIALDSYLVRAAALYAKLEVPGLGPLHAFCTHLNSPLGPIPYKGEHGSFSAEQLVQIDQLLAFIDEKAAEGERVILLGDMNTGPETDGLVGEWPSHYAALSYAFENPFLEQAGTCSYCPDNSLLSDATNPLLLDHLLVRAFPAYDASASRAFTEPSTIDQDLSSHLSDHYAVRVDFTGKP